MSRTPNLNLPLVTPTDATLLGDWIQMIGGEATGTETPSVLMILDTAYGTLIQGFGQISALLDQINGEVPES